MTPEDETARGRFTLLNLLKASGALLMLAGLAIVGTGFVEPRDLIGWPLFVVGFVDSLVLPAILARKWRTPK